MEHQLKVLRPEEYFIRDEPYYEPVADEIQVFEAAYQNRLPILLKGRTGCGKPRFMKHMAWRVTPSQPSSSRGQEPERLSQR